MLASAGIITIALAACPTEDDGGSDPAPIASVSVSPARVNEGGAVTVTVTLDRAVDSAATFTLKLGATAATDDTDADVDGADDNNDAAFADGVKTVTIAASNTTGTAMIAITDDTITEDDETFTVGLSAGPNGVTLSEAVATVTISDNDGGSEPAPIASVSVSPARVNEGGAVTATVTLDRALDSAATFILALGATAATDDTDADVDGADADAADVGGAGNDDDAAFAGGADTVTIAANTTTGTAMIAITDDTITEGDETFTVGLSAGPDGVTLSEAVATVTIASNDQAMATQVTSFSALSGSVSEGGAPATITIGLDGPAVTPLSFGYTIGGVDAADIDGNALSGTIGVALGDQSGTATITIEDDALIEGDETMTITLASSNPPLPIAGSIVPIMLTIGDNDRLEVEIVPASYRFKEGDTETDFGRDDPDNDVAPIVMLSVSGGELVGSDAEVSLTTVPGTATTDDFTARSADPADADAAVPIPVDDYTTAQTVSVPLEITDDAIVEIDETFRLELSESDPRVGVGTANEATVTIVERFNRGFDIVEVTWRLDRVTAEEGSAIETTIELASGSFGFDADFHMVLVEFVEIPGLGEEGRAADVDGMGDNDDAVFSIGSASDTITIPAGESINTGAIITITDDTTEEDEEVFYVRLRLSERLDREIRGNSINISGSNMNEVTIPRNDQAIATQVNGFTATPTTIGEGGDVTIAIVLDGEAQSQLSFGYAITGIAAADIADDDADSDGDALTGTIGVAQTNTMGMATITIEDDALIEGDETMTITLASFNPPLPIAGSIVPIMLTIDDNDTLSVEIAAATYAFAEDAATPIVMLSVSGGELVGSAAEISLTTVPGTATTDDFTARSGDPADANPAVPIPVLDYTTAQEILVPLAITDDTMLEIDETFSLQLSAPDGRVEVGSTSSAEVTIMGGGDPVTATIGIAATATEGDTVTATVTLDNRVGVDTTLTLELRSTADTNDMDADVDGVGGDDDASFSGGSNSVTIAAGMTTGSADITITNDDAIEEAETFEVGFPAGDVSDAVSFAVSGGAMPPAMIDVLEDHFTADDAQVVTIPRNDQEMASQVTSFTATPATIGESDGDVTIEIVLNGEAQSQLSFDYTIGGIQVADIAGDALTGTIGVAPTNAMGTETITIADDALIEGDETMTITLDTPPSGIMATGIDPVEVTITDDDTATATVIVSGATSEGDTATVTVTLDTGLVVDATFPLELGNTADTTDSDADVDGASPDDAALAASPMVTIGAGMTSATETVDLMITDDSAIDPEETFEVRIGVITFGGGRDLSSLITPVAATVTIADNDIPSATLSVTDSTVTEHAADGTSGEEAEFTLVLTGLPTEGADDVSVFFTLSGFAGALGDDDSFVTRLQTVTTTIGGDMGAGPHDLDATAGMGHGRVNLDLFDGDIAADGGSTVVFRIGLPNFDDNVVGETIKLRINCVARSRMGTGRDGCIAASAAPNLLNNPIVRLGAVINNDAEITVTDEEPLIPGNIWRSVTTPTSNLIHGVTWAGSQWVAVGVGGTILTAPSQAGTWTTRTSRTTLFLEGVASNPTGTQVMAVGDGGTIRTSSDGVTWTIRDSGTTSGLNSVTWTGSQWVVVGAVIDPAFPNTTTILTSSDGITWTPRNSGGLGEHLLGIAANSDGSQLVTVGTTGSIMTSSNGITWIEQTSRTSQNLFGVTWTGSQWVAVGDGGTILTSSNGTTWTGRTSGTRSGLNAVTWTGSQLVAVGNARTIRVSSDGITWTGRNSPSGMSSNFEGVASTDSRVVAVGTGGVIIRSP